MDLRVTDIDWERDQVVVQSGKGDKSRVTMLPAGVKEAPDWDRERSALDEDGTHSLPVMPIGVRTDRLPAMSILRAQALKAWARCVTHHPITTP
jgi:hypothetical protein